MFVLLWNIADFEAGLVQRCPTCYTSAGKIAEAYGQGTKKKCDDCFGTTFEGGYKAKLVRPSVWDTNADQESAEQRGEIITQTASIQSTPDFRMRTDDYILRADGTRWQMKSWSYNRLRTGFQYPAFTDTVIGFNYGTVGREDESSVAFLIPPATDDLIELLNVRHIHEPADFSSVDEIRDGAVLLP